MAGHYSNTSALPGSTGTDEAAFSADGEKIMVRIPRLDADAPGNFVDEAFLPRVNLNSGSTWIVDLSEYSDGITLSLAEMLARLNEEARGRGCVIRFSGMNDAFVR